MKISWWKNWMGGTSTLWNENVSSCELCLTLAKQNNPQQKCRLCDLHVCNLFCSIVDLNSSNEMHRIPRTGDNRCRTSESNTFQCPFCYHVLGDQTSLQSHIVEYHESTNQSLPSWTSDCDDSTWKYVKCNICTKLFESESDCRDHNERVHEYGELFQIYPCEYCGLRGDDILSIRQHMKEEHQDENESIEWLRIKKLP